MKGALLAPVLEPRVRPTKKWSLERIDVLRALWPTSTAPEAIGAALNALPGPAISIHDAGVKAATLLLSRPGTARNRLRNASEEDFEPIPADFDTIAAWAAEKKLPFRSWDDLRAINIMRERHQLLTYARKFPTKGVRGC